jgi:hypothetical protein
MIFVIFASPAEALAKAGSSPAEALAEEGLSIGSVAQLDRATAF